MLRDLGSFLDDDALEIPVDGKVYRIASPDAETGLFLAGLAQLGEKAVSGQPITAEEFARLKLNDEQEGDFMRMVLGDTLDELVADGVKWTKIQRVNRYAFLFFSLGPEAADRALESGVLTGEAMAPNRAQRRAASRAGAATTKRAASTGGTTSPRKPARKPTGT
ncbi:DUF7426 family protein [Amycolatopsis taiwanensis]|uniref:DUF7426 family protein n=1 Tax=Amycolatopsis taiwanensis TaxID=342230 RepID=UPI0004B3BAEB|nr:hypothetical protein [Amycolatopsis taiwanensis]